jgi:hemerythrin
MITANSTIDEIERMYHTEFHKIPHTKTFGVIIEKLKRTEQLNAEMLEVLKEYLSQDIKDQRTDNLFKQCKSIIAKTEGNHQDQEQLFE